jgi:hypothetical protein
MPKYHGLSNLFRSVLGLSLAFFLSPSLSLAQADSTALPPGISAPKEELPIKLKPTFGIGPGMLAFYGDVGNDHSAYSPLVTRVGYELRATTPITPWLEGGIYALHGRLGVNERSLTRNLNFESRITTGGVQFRYNFLQLLNPSRVVEPYVTVGFESVEYLTKTDLRDAQGRTYHYWSDGTIRDIDEQALNAGDAVLIQRDSHLRERCARIQPRWIREVPRAHLGRPGWHRCAYGHRTRIRLPHGGHHALHPHGPYGWCHRSKA